MLTLNLSTVSGQLQSSTATIDRGTRRVCSICGGTAAECLCVTQNPVMLGDDKGKADGDKDDPHHDIVARLEALYISSGPITVKQFTPIETVADYIAWCMGTSPRGCTDDDPCGSALCPYCG